MPTKITKPKSVRKPSLAVARQVLAIVDKGLVKGLGRPVPGEMCVEAAVAYAMGEPHGDGPSCVSPAVRSFKITLNDSDWSSDEARANGMRRIAIAQLGTAGKIDEKAFAQELALQTVRQILPIALRSAASLHHDPYHKAALEKAAKECESVAAYSAAYSAADSAYSAARSAADSAYSAYSAADSADSAYSAARSAYSAAYSAADSAYSAARSADSAYSAYSAARSADSAYSAAYSAADSAYSAYSAARSADSAARSAYSAAYSARSAAYKNTARDTVLSLAAEVGIAALRKVGAAGIAWMDKLAPSK